MLLQTHGRLQAPDLAQRLEVSVRTVLRPALLKLPVAAPPTSA